MQSSGCLETLLQLLWQLLPLLVILRDGIDVRLMTVGPVLPALVPFDRHTICSVVVGEETIKLRGLAELSMVNGYFNLHAYTQKLRNAEFAGEERAGQRRRAKALVHACLVADEGP